MSQEPKVALVTGASQGIGAGLVSAFLAKGYRVVANSRSIEPTSRKDLLTVKGDISDPKVATQAVSAAVKQFGRLDTLVNNAGVFIAKPFTEFNRDDLEKMFSVNLFGFWHVSQEAARVMLKQQRGHIVNVTTSLADQPIRGLPTALTSLTKGGLNAVTKELAMEFSEQGIRVNAVSPGIINTPMHSKDSHEFLAGLHPIKRMGSVEEIVEAVLYLESAQFVSGEVLHVDGGAHAGRW